MDSRTLKREHAAQINKSLHRSLNYLFRLQRRMCRVGFPPTDRLLQLVETAYNAMLALSVETHYLSCDSGVGMDREDDNEHQRFEH